LVKGRADRIAFDFDMFFHVFSQIIFIFFETDFHRKSIDVIILELSQLLSV